MFDDENRQSVAAPAERKKSKTELVFDGLSDETLVRYHHEITKRLPPLTLKDTNLEREMLLQLIAVRAIQNEVQAEEAVPANQRAQVASMVTAALSRLYDMQKDLYTIERYKRVENALVRMLASWPEDQVQYFLGEYQKILDELDQ
jgi:hypothetical protein